MSKFEAVLLYSPDISSSLLESEEKKFISNIEATSGKIINQEDWGIRELSYNIDKYKKAFYKYYQIEMDGNNIQNIKTNLTQNEKIVRNLFVKVENHQELPTKMVKNEEN